MNKKSNALTVALLTGLLAFGGASTAYAAEDAGGVAKYIGLSYESAKAALEAAKAGDKEKTIAALKQTRQNTKEITGDAAGMKLQKANQAVKQAVLDAEAGDLAKAAETLGPAVSTLEEMKKTVK